MKKVNVMIVGVGGQGSITMGQLFKQAVLDNPNIVVTGSETRGAAQREGSVNSTIRYAITESGEEFDERRSVHSVLIPAGEADVYIALEPVEGMRELSVVSDKTSIIFNSYVIKPMTCVVDGSPYPELQSMIDMLQDCSPDVVVMNGNEMARESFGDFQKMNIVLTGAALATGKLPFSYEEMEKTIKNRFKYDVEGNLKALKMGYNAYKKVKEAA
ncbi:MAG: 2-oxoacid:acceptor oxidoreductase family protein [Candidatus Helarchaeota archaeon]|nr:2-oxoacid:acceptor oxidoreductase family protein [Candidatus Helarchaeota archaeon]